MLRAWWMDGRDWTLRLRSIKFIVLCIEFQLFPSILIWGFHSHKLGENAENFNGIVQWNSTASESKEREGDREEDRFLRRSLISYLRLFIKASEMSSSGLSLLRLFRISSRAKTPNCHLGVTLTP
jgi:hypothetical protein